MGLVDEPLGRTRRKPVQHLRDLLPLPLLLQMQHGRHHQCECQQTDAGPAQPELAARARAQLRQQRGHVRTLARIEGQRTPQCAVAAPVEAGQRRRLQPLFAGLRTGALVERMASGEQFCRPRSRTRRRRPRTPAHVRPASPG